MAKRVLKEFINDFILFGGIEGIITEMTRDRVDADIDEDSPPKELPFIPRRRFERVDYDQTPWARMLQGNDHKCCETRQGRLFRRRFRVPYPVFEYIVRCAVCQ